MNKEETLALWRKGKDAWNAWAKEMLERCPATEVGACRSDDLATRDWLIDASADFEKHVFEDEAGFAGFIFPANSNFEGSVFKNIARFEESVFKSIAYFIDAKFCGDVRFDNATFEYNAQFDKVRFREEAYFYRTTFYGDAWFNGCRFLGNAHYENADFEKKARFDRAGFHSDALFDGVIFGGQTKFENSIFRGAQTNFIRAKFGHESNFRSRFRYRALFDYAAFAGDADFGGADFPSGLCLANAHFHGEATFAGNSFVKRSVGNVLFTGTVFHGYTVFHTLTFSGLAEFDRCCFKSYAAFLHTTFRQQAKFTAVQCESFFTFEGCEFNEVPNFIQAHFTEAPRLDNVSVPEVGGIARFFLPVLPGIDANADTSARYRALKRLAIQAHDHTREMNYFSSELKALRGNQQRFLPCLLNLLRKDETGRRMRWWPGGLRGTTKFWFGLGYEILSNFGRSIALPLIWLSVTAFVCAWCYLGLHFGYVAEHRQAYGLSSLEWIGRWVVSLFAGSPPLLSCVDGSFGEPWVAARLLSLAKTLPYAGVVPAEKSAEVFACLYGSSIPSCVVVIGMVQLVLSLLLLFLFLLAVRNHFRIR